MIYDVWLPLLIPLLAVPAARRLADALPPRPAAWLLVGCGAALALCSTGALLLLATAGLLHLPPVAALGHLSLPLFDRGESLTFPAGAAATIALTLCVIAGARAYQGFHSELRHARMVTRAQPAGGELFVLPDAWPDAYALPGRPGRIVITTGMLRVLDPAEREVLLAHERAHLSGRHHRFVVIGEFAALCHPMLRGLRAPLRFALERWADESAAAAIGDRRLTARAIGRAALATLQANRHGGGPGSARPRTVLGATTGPVPRRVAALLNEVNAPVTGVGSTTRGPVRPGRVRRRGRQLLATALLACLAVSASATMDAALDLHGSVELAQAETTPDQALK